jgi:hypothetical protein
MNRRLVVSVGIVACLGLQALAGFRVLCPPRSLVPSLSWLHVCAPRLWPFLDYPMYSAPHRAGDVIDQFRVFGRLDDSSEVPILPADLHLDPFEFMYTFASQLQEATNETAHRYADIYQRTRGRRLVELRLENHPLVLSRDGVRPGPVRIVKEFRF